MFKEDTKKLYLTPWLLSFSLAFTVSFISPVVPYLVKSFLQSEREVALTIGFLTSMYSAANAVSSFIGGFATDKHGRRKTIFGFLPPLSIGLLLFAFSKNVYWLYAGYFLAAFTFGSIFPVLNALVADLTPARERGAGYGLFNLSWILSQIPSPLIGGWLASNLNLRTPFVLAFIFSLTLFVIAYRVEDVEKKNYPEKEAAEQVNPKQIFKSQPFKFTLILFCLINLLWGLGNGVLSPLFKVYLLFKLGVSPLEMGLAFSIGWALVTALVQVPGGKISDKIGRKPLIVTSLTTVSPLIMALGLTSNIEQFIAVLVLISALGNLSNPAVTAFLMDLTDERNRGKALGVTESIFSLGTTVGPVIGGYLWSIYKAKPVIPFTIASVVFLLELPLILMIQEKKTP